jgi:hypothetical protein
LEKIAFFTVIIDAGSWSSVLLNKEAVYETHRAHGRLHARFASDVLRASYPPPAKALQILGSAISRLFESIARSLLSSGYDPPMNYYPYRGSHSLPSPTPSPPPPSPPRGDIPPQFRK